MSVTYKNDNKAVFNIFCNKRNNIDVRRCTNENLRTGYHAVDFCIWLSKLRYDAAKKRANGKYMKLFIRK
ncbi:MAG: hypothetical protein A2Y97_13570 [Nitrospirae bacterium RBG_13_39_12]|nr:MAG: hypothetical protein A2Y97_13570 [Nitrospirae bacterium RBG_13_39_12]